MTAGRPFSDVEKHLLTHAAAMGGWLSVSYSSGDYDEPMCALLRDGLFRREPRDGRGVHQLTAAGVRAVEALRGAAS